jgi:hypothetical protein
MNRPLRSIVLGSLLAATQLTAFAQAASTPAPTASMPRVDQRQQKQEQRIDQGVAGGQLTPHEAAKLERRQARVDQAENKALADGTVTKKEKAKLHKMQDGASKGIYHQKHDRQHAASAPASK